MDFRLIRGSKDRNRVDIRGVEFLAFMRTIGGPVSRLTIIYIEIVIAASFLLCFIDRTSLLESI